MTATEAEIVHEVEETLASLRLDRDDGADESKTVEYLTFHAPYITPCSNRLAPPLAGDDRQPI